MTPGSPDAEVEERDDAEEGASEREDENAADAGEHMNPLAREGGVAGDDDVGDGVGGGGGPSVVI